MAKAMDGCHVRQAKDYTFAVLRAAGGWGDVQALPGLFPACRASRGPRIRKNCHNPIDQLWHNRGGSSKEKPLNAILFR
jgi:hypothetical protein